MKFSILFFSAFFAIGAIAAHNHLSHKKLKELPHHILIDIILMQEDQKECLKEELKKLRHELHDKHKFHELEKALIDLFD